MYNYNHRDWFYVDGTYKQILIICAPIEEEGEPLTLTNADLEEESFEYFDSIMNNDTFTLANCMCCYVRFVTYNTTEQLIERVISVYEVIERDTENPIPLGIFTVKQDNISTDGKTREIIAYDQMYDVINTNMTEWYNSQTFPMTIKNLRDIFFEEFGIQQDLTSLINDDISVPKQISENDIISGDIIVKAIAELNCVFAHFDKQGILRWISLDVGNPYSEPLYPSLTTFPGETTYPGRGYAGNLFNIYKAYHKEDSVVWANYETIKADGVQLRNEYSEIAWQTNPVAENPYTVIGNFLCYNLSAGQLQVIAERLYNKLRLISYVPFQQTKMWDPCLEVGDRAVVFVKDNHELVSYVFTKHAKGIQVPFEDLTTKGSLYFSQYEVGKRSAAKSTQAQIKNLDNRIGNIEKSGSGPLQIRSVAQLPETVELNVLYLIQGDVEIENE